MKIIRKSIIELNESEKKEIDQFIDMNGGLVFHYTKLNEIVSSANHTVLSYFIAYIDKEMIGICPIHSVRKGLVSSAYSNNGSYEIPYGGWVFNENVTSFEQLWNSLPSAHFESLTYWTTLMYDIPDVLKSGSSKLESGLIDLSVSNDDIWQKCVHSKRRNMIRKAEKSDIIIKNYGSEGIRIFYNMMIEMKYRAGLKEKPCDYYEKILSEYYPEKAIVSIALIADKPITGAIILGNKNMMHYWKGASVVNVPNVGQGELLQWEAIKWSKNKGAKYYDLCVIEPQRLPHIAKFKMGFSKTFVTFYCITKKTLLFRVINKIQNVFTN
jgi:hypothetical protein